MFLEERFGRKLVKESVEEGFCFGIRIEKVEKEKCETESFVESIERKAEKSVV